ncbi:MAG: hypothetical protein Q4G13_10025 [Moraxella sp.]|nr:hypothetical protein [Moraxella sp.]
MTEILPYPIELYTPKQNSLLSIISGLVAIGGGAWFYSLWLSGKADALLIVLSLLLAGFGITIVCVGLYFLTHNVPVIIIHHHGIKALSPLSRGFKQIILWQDIKNLELFSRTYKGAVQYQLVITKHDGKLLRLPIRKKIYQPYHQSLNEREIFQMIEQSFQGKPVQYKAIRMTVDEHYDMQHWKMMAVIGGLILIMLLIGNLMG